MPGTYGTVQFGTYKKQRKKLIDWKKTGLMSKAVVALSTLDQVELATTVAQAMALIMALISPAVLVDSAAVAQEWRNGVSMIQK